MVIQWYGHACFRITGSQTDVSILIDPFDPSLGRRLPKLNADILLSTTDLPSHRYEESVRKGEDATFVANTPGEIETKGVFVTGVLLEQKQRSVAYSIHLDELFIVHLGALSRNLSEQELDALGRVDILLLPIGGGEGLSPAKAVEVITQVEPRVVIPMQYQTAGLKTATGTLQIFLKEYGVKDIEHCDKIKYLKKDLPSEETQLVILDAVN